MRTRALALLAAVARGSENATCDPAAALLPFGGVCPASETVCPPCPAAAPVKCPSGLCRADVRPCPPHLFFRGECDGVRCEGVEWCHLYPRREHACWEAGLSEQNASVVFEALDPTQCGHCLASIHSHYPCDRCCGAHATARWSGTYASDRENARGGGVFMTGQWVCMLAEVAGALGLANSAVASLVPPPPPDAAAADGGLAPLTDEELDELLSYPMPSVYHVYE